MRKMRRQCQNLVVIVGIHTFADRPHRGDKTLKSDDLFIRHLTGDHKPVAPLEEVGESGRGARMLGPGKRMRRQPVDMALQMRRDIPDHRPFGGAGVGQHRPVLHRRNDSGRQRANSADRHRHDDKIGICDGSDRIVGEAVHEFQPCDLGRHRRVGIAAGNVADGTGTACRESD